MKVLLKQETLEQLADEVVELISNSKKLSDMLKAIKENETIQKRNLSEINKLRNKMNELENRMNKLVKNFKIDIIEAERLITEKSEKIIEDNEKRIISLVGEIENLKDLINRIRNEIK